MLKVYVYLDESGSIHKNSTTKYFAIGGYFTFSEDKNKITSLYKRINKKIKDTRNIPLSKEIKSYDMKDEEKIMFFNKIQDIDILHKRFCFSEYLISSAFRAVKKPFLPKNRDERQTSRGTTRNSPLLAVQLSGASTPMMDNGITRPALLLFQAAAPGRKPGIARKRIPPSRSL